MAMIICKECGKEVSDKANSCPNCGCPISSEQSKNNGAYYQKPNGNLPKQEQPKKKKKGIWIVVAVICLFAGCGACMGGSDEDTQNVASDSNPQKVDTVEVEETTEITEETDNEFNVGDVVETSDWKITYISAEEWTSDNKYIQPNEGNVYYRMEFEFENISDHDQLASSWDFECYADDYSVDQSYAGDDDLQATLSSGKKTKGAVYYEVPADANNIVLEYETNFWSEDKVIFIVK